MVWSNQLDSFFILVSTLSRLMRVYTVWFPKCTYILQSIASRRSFEDCFDWYMDAGEDLFIDWLRKDHILGKCITRDVLYIIIMRISPELTPPSFKKKTNSPTQSHKELRLDLHFLNQYYKSLGRLLWNITTGKTVINDIVNCTI